MKYLLLLLPLTLVAELYECKDSFLYVQSNSITIVTEDSETLHARRGYGSFCYDFQSKDKEISICLQKNGDTFTWTTSEGERTEKCVRVD